MKVLLLIISFVIGANISFGQITIANKTLNGKKVGFWSEIIPCDTIDSNKQFHIIYDSPNNPVEAWSEGFYVGGLKEGFWKEYWVTYFPTTEYLSKGAVARGSVKTIREYEKGVPVGLFVEYHRNENIKAIGQFGNQNHTDETVSNSPWYFYNETGQLLQK